MNKYIFRSIHTLLVLFIFANTIFGQSGLSEAKRLFDKGQSFHQRNMSDSAVVYFENSAELFWELYNQEKNNQYLEYYLYSIDLATYHANALGQYDNSIELINKAIAFTSKLIDQNNSLYANLYDTRALAYKAQKKYQYAFNDFQKCLEIRRNILGENHVKLSSTYYNMGEVKLNTGEYKEAAEYFKKELELSESDPNKDPAQLILTYNNLGASLIHNNKYQDALNYLRKAVNLISSNDAFQQSFIETHRNYVLALEESGYYKDALNHLEKTLKLINNQEHSQNQKAQILKKTGDLYTKQGQYNKALTAYNKSMNLLSEKETETLDTRTELNNSIGKLYEYKGDYSNSYKFYKKAFQLIQRENIPSGISLITYNNLGNYWDIQGDYKKALDFFKKAVNLEKEEHGEETLNLAKSYGNLGKVYLHKGVYDEAWDYMNKSLAIYYKMYPDKNNPGLSTAYNNIGNLYNETGKYDKALEYYEKDLNLSQQFYGQDNPAVASSYNNIANVYYHKREYERALEYYNKALGIYQSSRGEEHPSMIDIYNNLGNIYEQRENFSKSLEYHTMAVKLKELVFGKEYPGLADSYNNIGNSYLSEEKYDSALVYYNRAIELNKDLYGENHVNLARSYGNLGNIYRKKEAYDTARMYYQKSVKIFRETLGTQHPETASTYNNLGHVAFDEEAYEEAVKFYQHSIIANTESYNDSSHLLSKPALSKILNQHILLEALLNKADAIVKLADKQKKRKKEESRNSALMHYELCDSLIVEIRKGTHTEKDKLAIGTQSYRVYSSAVDLCMDKVRSADNQKEKNLYLRKAFAFSEKNKSRILLQSISDAKAIQFAGIPDEMLTKEKNLKVEIAYYREKIAGSKNSEEKLSLRNKLFELKRDYESLIQSFEENYSEYYKLKHSTKNVTISQLQNNLPDKTAAISYFVGDSALTWFYISKNDFHGKKIEKPSVLTDSLEMFRYGLIYKNSSRFQKIYKEMAHKYYKELFPGEINADIENILVIPDAELNTIPYEALLTDKISQNNNDYSQFPYLVRKYQISYAYSATLYHEIFNNRKTTTEATSYDWLGMAPVFSGDQEKSLTISTDRSGKEHIKSTEAKKEAWSVDGEFISALPGTEKEIKEIFGHFKEHRKLATAKIHRTATEEYFKNTNLDQYKIIHLATHGFVNSENPDKSGIIFADGAESKEDGVLHTNEIYNLSLNTNLVNLSACETGLGKIAKGEGIVGLTRAMIYAGTENIIVSLWKVYDESTRNLMVDFYKAQIKQNDYKSFRRSLRDSKISMIENGQYAHPFYWAAFILIGK